MLKKDYLIHSNFFRCLSNNYGKSLYFIILAMFKEKNLTPLVKERLKALQDAQELGAGYRLAIRDLELRGAGNILGREQSGAINKIGLNLYSQMISEAIERYKE